MIEKCSRYNTSGLQKMLPVKRLSVEGKETYIAGYQKSENDLEMIKL